MCILSNCFIVTVIAVVIFPIFSLYGKEISRRYVFRRKIFQTASLISH